MINHQRILRSTILTAVCALAVLATSGVALAQDITVKSGETKTMAIIATGNVLIEKGGVVSPGKNPGVFSEVAGSTIRNDGEIAGTPGILVIRAGMTVINSGSITTASTGQQNVHGINSDGDNATITNSGSITTTGPDTHGIFSTGDNATIINSGTITTTGANAHGIYLGGDNSTTTITGRVSATGQNSHAVLGGNNGTHTLNIGSGAQIIGKINLGDSGGGLVGPRNDLVNILPATRAGPSATYTFERVEAINLASSALALRSGDTVVTFDPTGSSATRMALGSVTGQIHRRVFQHLGATPPAALEDNGGWGTVFVTRAERDDDGLALAFDQHFYGAVGGYDGRLDSGQRVGLFAGLGQGQVETADVASIKDTAERVFMGVYGQHAMGDLTLNGTVMLGYARHDASRTVLDNVAGYEPPMETTTASISARPWPLPGPGNWAAGLSCGPKRRSPIPTGIMAATPRAARQTPI